MNRKIEISVGFFTLIALCAVLFLCFKVTDSSSFMSKSTYRVYAVFDNVGGLKVRSPVKIGGVVIGRISDIKLNEFKPYVSLDIESKYNNIPTSSTLAIKTSGLLGEQFIDISIGIDTALLDDIDSDDNGKITPSNNQFLTEGFVTHNTTPAMVIEDLIGKFLYSNQSNTKNSQE